MKGGKAAKEKLDNMEERVYLERWLREATTQDRIDMQFAAKEVPRLTAKPEEQDWNSTKSLARYLKDNKRVVIEYKYQKLPERVAVWSDTARILRDTGERGVQRQEA